MFPCALSEPSGKCPDPEPYISSQRDRFLSCRNLWDEVRLDIIKFIQLPLGDYCAVSYAWRGVPTEENASNWAFSVKNVEDGDPISADVFENIVWAAFDKKKGCLWLDRLGLCQSSKPDRSWQIQADVQLCWIDLHNHLGGIGIPARYN